MGSRLQQLLLLLSIVLQAGAHVYSCEEVRYRIINKTLGHDTQYACVVIQEGFNNTNQLKKIFAKSDDVTTSFADIANSATSCVEKSEYDGPWAIIGNSGFTLNCDQEFTLIFTSEDPTFIKPLFKKRVHVVQHQRVFVVPQVGMWLHKKSCIGEGSVKLWTGAGAGENEERYPIRQWTCDTLPEWICLFDNVATIESEAQLSVECTSAQDLNSNIEVSPRERIAVFVNGRSDNLQNLKESEHFAYVGVKNEEKTDVTVNMQLTFDSTNTGSVELMKKFAGKRYPFKNGTYTEKFNTDYFEVRWVPKQIQAAEIWKNSDSIYVDITMNKSIPEPVESGTYCACDVDKTGYAVGWEYKDIWLDVIIILDTSAAMSSAALTDAGNLIESLFNGVNGYLDTRPSGYYTRVGVIAMSDEPKILYNLNMTDEDKVVGKVTINKGVAGIDVIDAYNAALSMFHDGIKNDPGRADTRQVIHYMTATDPKNDLGPLDQFKDTDVIIVNNFATGGKDLSGLKILASNGYYFTKNTNMQVLQYYCKANCYCKSNKFAYGGVDPATKASGGCYHPELTGVPFNKAKDTCSMDDGIIAAIHDQSKGLFVQELMSKAKSDYFWIGYAKADDGFWQWEDESTNPYTNWDVDEPLSTAVAKCGYADKSQQNIPWGAGNCQVGFPYVCEYPPCAVGNTYC